MLARILDEIETFDVSPDMRAAMLSRGLGEGAGAGSDASAGHRQPGQDSRARCDDPVAGNAEAILDTIDAAEALAGLPATRRMALVRTSADRTAHFD